jgi:hypothetical protein
MFLAMTTILCGWVLAEQGQGEEGVAQICQGLATYKVIEEKRFGHIALPCWSKRVQKWDRWRKD